MNRFTLPPKPMTNPAMTNPLQSVGTSLQTPTSAACPHPLHGSRATLHSVPSSTADANTNGRFSGFSTSTAAGSAAGGSVNDSVGGSAGDSVGEIEAQEREGDGGLRGGTGGEKEGRMGGGQSFGHLSSSSNSGMIGVPQVLPGHAAVVDPSLPWSQLEAFGPNFLSRFEVVHVNSAVFRGITLIDSPGVLAGNKQWERGYDFEGVIRWFAERVDLVLLFFDAHKLDISDEFRRCILALKGHEGKVCILLNKADSVTSQQLMRVYGALMWSLGKVMPAPEVPRIHIGSFWDQPLRNEEARKLFEIESDDLFKLIYSLPARSAARKIDDFLKRLRRCRVHALIVDHLRRQLPSMRGRSTRQKELLASLPEIFLLLSKEHNVPLSEFPNVEEFRSACVQIGDLHRFPKLDQKKIRELNSMLQTKIAALTKLIPQEEVSFVFNVHANHLNRYRLTPQERIAFDKSGSHICTGGSIDSRAMAEGKMGLSNCEPPAPIPPESLGLSDNRQPAIPSNQHLIAFHQGLCATAMSTANTAEGQSLGAEEAFVDSQVPSEDCSPAFENIENMGQLQSLREIEAERKSAGKRDLFPPSPNYSAVPTPPIAHSLSAMDPPAAYTPAANSPTVDSPTINSPTVDQPAISSPAAMSRETLKAHFNPQNSQPRSLFQNLTKNESLVFADGFHPSPSYGAVKVFEADSASERGSPRINNPEWYDSSSRPLGLGQARYGASDENVEGSGCNEGPGKMRQTSLLTGEDETPSGGRSVGHPKFVLPRWLSRSSSKGF